MFCILFNFCKPILCVCVCVCERARALLHLRSLSLSLALSLSLSLSLLSDLWDTSSPLFGEAGLRAGEVWRTAAGWNSLRVCGGGEQQEAPYSSVPESERRRFPMACD